MHANLDENVIRGVVVEGRGGGGGYVPTFALLQYTSAFGSRIKEGRGQMGEVNT
jgi:hypothetical protein